MQDVLLFPICLYIICDCNVVNKKICKGDGENVIFDHLHAFQLRTGKSGTGHSFLDPIEKVSFPFLSCLESTSMTKGNMFTY